MVGLIQILIYMLAVYFVFKGVEILQIALMSTREDRTLGMIIGGFSILAAVVIGVSFAIWGDMTAKAISDRMNSLPGFR